MSTASGLRDDAREMRNRLVEELVRQGAITSQQVQQAFEEVPRHLFVPRADITTAYSDEPIFIRWEEGIPISSSSQPKMMALMMEQLGLEPGSRVLEIGAGTGYNAAILAHVAGEEGCVTTMDIDQDIVDEAAGNLSRTGYDRVTVVCGDGFEGFPEGQPYDRIIATVGAYDVSPHWVDQLKEGGVIVAPLWFRGYCLSVALEKRGGELRGLSVTPCLFMPLRGVGQPTEGFFSVGDPPDEYLKMTVGLDRDDPAFGQELRRLFSQDADLRDAGRSLEGQFHTRSIFSGLVLFLTVDPRVFILYSASLSSPFREFGYGLIDLDSMSAAVVSASIPEHVVVYGNDTAYSHLIDLLDQWDRLGHPPVHDLHVRALFEPPESVPEDHWIITKRSAYTWMLSWRT